MDSERLKGQWANICTQVNSYPDVDAGQASAFLARLEPQAMSDSFLMLTADNDFIKQWVEQHYLEIIVRALRDLTGTTYAVAIAINPTQDQAVPGPAAVGTNMTSVSPSISITEEEYSRPAAAAPVIETAPAPSPFVSKPAYEEAPLAVSPAADSLGSTLPDGLASTFTFSNYVIGDSNRMAYSMAVEVAEIPGRPTLNPLFIYGKSGLGKTHLMRAIQNYISETRPTMNTVYVDAADFLTRYAEAASAHDKEKSSFKNFRSKYEEADVLLIDDVQKLQGKTSTLDVAFQLLNNLTTRGKQIVLAADRAPRNIDIDVRYQSRFAAGTPVAIDPPEVETKLGIVKSFMKEYVTIQGVTHLSLPDDVQLYIAENSGNVRELKGAVSIVIGNMIAFHRSDITLEVARDLLKNQFTGGVSTRITVEDIQREVENFFKVSHQDLVGSKRNRNIAEARHIACYLCRQILDLPFGEIGKKFGHRDHSTILHSVTTVERQLATNSDTQEVIEFLIKNISS